VTFCLSNWGFTVEHVGHKFALQLQRSAMDRMAADPNDKLMTNTHDFVVRIRKSANGMKLVD
jgi:hypothetical protein